MRLVLLTLFVFCIVSANALPAIDPPRAITRFNPGKEIISLNCKWEFYWNKLLSPADLKQTEPVKPDTLLVPSSWGGIKLKGQPIGNKGFATYRLKIVDAGNQDLMLDVYSVQTSCRVFVNGQLMLEVGKAGTTKKDTEPVNRDAQVYIHPQNNEVELVVQVANFHHRKGGFVHPFEIGKPHAILKQRNLYYYLDFIESTALAIIGLFLFAMYIFRRKDMSILYFSLFCLTLAFRPMISVNYFLATLFPGINWGLLLKIEYLSAMLPCLFMLLFIRELFPKQLPKLFVRILS
ncbi:MAG TPA: 7TM diverse intracellular signaling domain-containing protein, partial [Flavobacteriales bacterium]|nr:7TM diverse intracellular signaling domain-containing protein [Flavobacteriales bacterium]